MIMPRSKPNVISAYLIAAEESSKWWNSLTKKEKENYLKHHPDSKFGPGGRTKLHEKAVEEAKKRNENLQKAREAAAKKREEEKAKKEAEEKAKEEAKKAAEEHPEGSRKDDHEEEDPSASEGEGETPDVEDQDLHPVGEKPDVEETHQEMSEEDFEQPEVKAALKPKSQQMNKFGDMLKDGAAHTAKYLLSSRPFVDGFHAIRAMGSAVNEGTRDSAKTTVEVAEAMRALLKLGTAAAGLSASVPIAIAGVGVGVGAALTLNPVAAAGALALLFGATKLAQGSVGLLTASALVVEAEDLHHDFIMLSRTGSKIKPIKGAENLSDQELIRLAITKLGEHLRNGDFSPDQLRKMFLIKRSGKGKKTSTGKTKNRSRSKTETKAEVEMHDFTLLCGVFVQAGTVYHGG